MKEYRIKPEGFQEIKRQSLVRTIPMTLIVIAVGISISVLNSGEKVDSINVLPYIIPIAVGVVVLGVILGLKRQRQLYESFSLKVTSNAITRVQLSTPTISIYTSEVNKIFKNRNGNIVIKGKDSSAIINVPAQIENISDLEVELERIMPISIQDGEHFMKKYQGLVSLLTVGLMFLVYTVNNKLLVFISGVVLIAILSWSFYEIRRNNNIDSKTKRMGLWVILVLASIIGIMYFKLTGSYN